ncbi:MAG: oligosaccharide flippase family protein [Candidatus Zixiibacteriota bacterium]
MSSLVGQFGKNIFTSWASLAVRVILVFLVNPFIIHTLGNEQYGVWILIISILNYVTILDLGIKQALLRFVSKYLGLGDIEKVNAMLSTAFFIYGIIGLAVIATTFVLSFFVFDWLQIPEQFLVQGRLALLIMGLNCAMGFVMISRGDSLGALHRYDVVYGLMILEDILRTAAILILLKTGYGLVAFALAFFIFSQLRLFLGAVIQKKLFPKIRVRFKPATREVAGDFLKYGFISFLISFAWLFISNTDNILIGYFLDTSSVTKYAIGAGFIVYLRAFIHAVSFPLRPVISHYETTDKLGNIKFIYTRGIKYFSFLTFIVGGITLNFADYLIFLWMGPGYEVSALMLKILILPAAVFLPQAIAVSVMYGVDKHRILLYIIIVEGLLNLVLSVLLVGRYGLTGIAIGTAIPQVLIYLLVVPIVIKSILNIDLRHYYLSLAYAAGIALAGSYLFGYLLIHLFSPENWGIFFAEVLLVAGLSAAAGLLVFDRDEFLSIFTRLRGNNRVQRNRDDLPV